MKHTQDLTTIVMAGQWRRGGRNCLFIFYLLAKQRLHPMTQAAIFLIAGIHITVPNDIVTTKESY